FGDPVRSAALRHEVPLAIIDPLLWAQSDDRTAVLTTDIERSRIAAHLPDVEILDFFDFGYRELRQQGCSTAEATREVVARAVQSLGIGDAVVPEEFPVGLADRLRSDGVRLVVDEQAIASRRRAKHGHELDGVRAAQRAAEAGMAAAEAILARAEPGGEGRLYVDNEELHAEHVRDALRAACAELGSPGAGSWPAPAAAARRRVIGPNGPGAARIPLRAFSSRWAMESGSRSTRSRRSAWAARIA